MTIVDRKTCSSCKICLSIDAFHRSKSRRDGRHHACKDCSKKYYKKWQEQKPETRKRYSDWREARRIEARQYLVNFLRTKSCADCGNSDIRVLVFDHVIGIKTNGVATMASNGNSLDKIKEEIAKCEVRCCNCHAIVTAVRGNWWSATL